MIDQPQRQQISLDIQIAVDSGASYSAACHSIGLHPRPQATRSTPAHALSEQERQQILDTCNSTEYSHLPPSQIVPKLADQGHYIASERSFYRILKQANQLTHRGRQRCR